MNSGLKIVSDIRFILIFIFILAETNNSQGRTGRLLAQVADRVGRVVVLGCCLLSVLR